MTDATLTETATLAEQYLAHLVDYLGYKAEAASRDLEKVRGKLTKIAEQASNGDPLSAFDHDAIIEYRVAQRIAQGFDSTIETLTTPIADDDTVADRIGWLRDLYRQQLGYVLGYAARGRHGDGLEGEVRGRAEGAWLEAIREADAGAIYATARAVPGVAAQDASWRAAERHRYDVSTKLDRARSESRIAELRREYDAAQTSADIAQRALNNVTREARAQVEDEIGGTITGSRGY
jgi:hypothetical protein